MEPIVIVILILLCAIPLQALFVWLYVKSLPQEKREQVKGLFKRNRKAPPKDEK